MQHSATRNDFLDHLKGFLIVLVVYGHVLQYFGYHDQSFFSDPVFKFIYIFHMPLFMMVSGYSAPGTFSKYSSSQFFSRKFRQLLLPTFSWSVALTLFYCLLAPKPDTLAASARFFAHTLLLAAAGFWYIWALFLGFIVVFIARWAKKWEIAALVALNALVLLVPNIFALDPCKFVLPFFCLGYLLSKSAIEVRLPNVVYIGCILCTVLIYFTWNKNFFIYISGMSLSHGNFPIILYRFFACLLFSTAIYETVRRFHAFLPSKGLSFLGQHTLSIYLAQYFFLAVGIHMPLMGTLLFWLVVGPILTSLFIFIILQIEKLLASRPLPRLLFLGQQSRPAAKGTERVALNT